MEQKANRRAKEIAKVSQKASRRAKVTARASPRAMTRRALRAMLVIGPRERENQMESSATFAAVVGILPGNVGRIKFEPCLKAQWLRHQMRECHNRHQFRALHRLQLVQVSHMFQALPNMVIRFSSQLVKELSTVLPGLLKTMTKTWCLT